MLGVKHITIIRWLKESGGTFVPPETETMVTGADGKQYPATKPKPEPKPTVVTISGSANAEPDFLSHLRKVFVRCFI